MRIAQPHGHNGAQECFEQTPDSFQPYGLRGEALKAWEAENIPDEDGLTVIIVRWADRAAEAAAGPV